MVVIPVERRPQFVVSLNLERDRAADGLGPGEKEVKVGDLRTFGVHIRTRKYRIAYRQEEQRIKDKFLDYDRRHAATTSRIAWKE
jgi:hypothetical protein